MIEKKAVAKPTTVKKVLNKMDNTVYIVRVYTFPSESPIPQVYKGEPFAVTNEIFVTRVWTKEKCPNEG